MTECLFSDQKSGYLLSPPTCISDSIVSGMTWAPDSSKLAFFRTSSSVLGGFFDPVVEAQPVQTEVVVYNAKNRSARTIFTYGDPGKSGYRELKFLGSTQVLTYLDGWDQQGTHSDEVAIIDIQSGAVSKWKGSAKATLSVTGNDAAPYLAITRELDSGELVLDLVNASGVQKSFPLGTTKGKLLQKTTPSVQLSTDGKTANFLLRVVPGTKMREVDQLEVNLSDGAVKRFIGPFESMRFYPGEQDNPKFQLSSRRKGGARSYRLSATKPGEIAEAIVTTDASSAQISPNYKQVSYVSRGALLVRAIEPVDLTVAKRANIAALKTKAITQAKIVATGFIMYASDSDDGLPSNTSDWKTALDPYLQDSDMAENFRYTFGGGDLTKVENPAETVMGYVDGPGGRAIAYLDGHVKWKNSP